MPLLQINDLFAELFKRFNCYLIYLFLFLFLYFMYLFLYFFVKQRSHLLDPHLYVEAYAAICHIRVNLMPLCFENLMPLCLNGLKVLC